MNHLLFIGVGQIVIIALVVLLLFLSLIHI